MIAYDLKCRNGHQFEAWFKNLNTFERQRKRSLIQCPRCSSAKIEMIYRPQAIRRNPRLADSPAGASNVQKLRDFLQEHFEDVGKDFAEEARRLHHGESEPRNIRGETTAEEEKELVSEGIGFLKVALPKPSN